jgi:hypothetical protein
MIYVDDHYYDCLECGDIDGMLEYIYCFHDPVDCLICKEFLNNE